MAHNDKEIEIQVNIEKMQPLMDFLKKSAEFKSEKHQLDEYYSAAHRDFLAVRPVKEWLRLRDSGGHCSINYKYVHHDADGSSPYRDEYETKIDSIDQARKIFTALNFKLLVTVDKLRNTWLFDDYEITVDSIRGLGDFVEMEYCGTDSDADPRKITKEMVEFLKKLGCGKIERNYGGYPYLLLFPGTAKTEVY